MTRSNLGSVFPQKLLCINKSFQNREIVVQTFTLTVHSAPAKKLQFNISNEKHQRRRYGQNKFKLLLGVHPEILSLDFFWNVGNLKLFDLDYWTIHSSQTKNNLWEHPIDFIGYKCA